ncbi:DUF3995 domain-containing protein [Shimia biformata]|uniref:DUF3995 domain-containing protein n=1 Tax=Shimia biformata TaxID=1294299 RepID=UPI00195098B7|nr:DUF3995 domain-containing protein [Shimia biformata]
MTFIAFLFSATLIVIAALHLVWALGIWLPIRDEAQLTRTVVGAKGMAEMPGPVPCAMVAMICLFLAILPHLTSFPFRVPLMSAAGAVFILRGFAPFFPAWRRLFPEQPFARLDRLFYGRLCILLGLALLFLIPST